ncbi:MAG: polyprenyl synthetase family protein [Pseudomonadota bacterium]
MLRDRDGLRALVEEYLAELALTPELHALEEPVRYALAGGGKRVRPVLCLATAEAAGADAELALPAAAALELVHSFSLVHDDLPALDDDDERRGRPTVHVRFGEDVAVLAGDALLAEAFRLALSYGTPRVGRELAQATLGMIGGQYLDLRGGADEETVDRLKTGRLFDAAVACGLHVAAVSEAAQAPWRAFAAELGVLFQTVDDLIDGDGSVVTRGEAWTRRAAEDAASRALAALEAIPADTSVLAEIAEALAARTS